MKNNVDFGALAESKQAVNRAFAKLKSQGYMARQNFSCCGGCAMYECGTDIDAAREGFKVVKWTEYRFVPGEIVKRKDGTSYYIPGGRKAFTEYGYEALKNGPKQYKGVVVYNRQSNDVWDGDRGQLAIAYSGPNDEDPGNREQKAVGEALAGALRAEGLSVEWNGDPNLCVLVDVGLGTDPVLQQVRRRQVEADKRYAELWAMDASKLSDVVASTPGVTLDAIIATAAADKQSTFPAPAFYDSKRKQIVLVMRAEGFQEQYLKSKIYW